MKNIFILLLALMTTFACTSREKPTKEAIVNDSPEMIHEGNEKLSNIVEVTKAIALETTDECLLGEIEKIMVRDGLILVKSQNSPLTIFDKNGKYLNKIGKIGNGPEECPIIIDFDLNKEHVYILTAHKIQVYRLNGEWEASMPLSLNASGIRLVGEEILLSVLGDKHSLHLLAKDGQDIAQFVESNETLRLIRAISLVRYDDKILYPMGRSNELAVYDPSHPDKAGRLAFLSSNRLTNEQEAKLIKEGARYKEEISKIGCFDGLLTDDTHVIVPYIKNNEVFVWMKNRQSGQCQAYPLSSIENDLTFGPLYTFFYDNTENDKAFTTYIHPQKLKDNMSSSDSSQHNPYVKLLQKALENTSEESNPIIIDYKVK